MRTPSLTTVTMLHAVPAVQAKSLGLTGAQNAVGQVLTLPHRDALALVTGGYARFGSDAADAKQTPTAFAGSPTYTV